VFLCGQQESAVISHCHMTTHRNGNCSDNHAAGGGEQQSASIKVIPIVKISRNRAYSGWFELVLPT
jgi:hypothetical protein